MPMAAVAPTVAAVALAEELLAATVDLEEATRNSFLPNPMMANQGDLRSQERSETEDMVAVVATVEAVEAASEEMAEVAREVADTVERAAAAWEALVVEATGVQAGVMEVRVEGSEVQAGEVTEAAVDSEAAVVLVEQAEDRTVETVALLEIAGLEDPADLVGKGSEAMMALTMRDIPSVVAAVEVVVVMAAEADLAEVAVAVAVSEAALEAMAVAVASEEAVASAVVTQEEAGMEVAAASAVATQEVDMEVAVVSAVASVVAAVVVALVATAEVEATVVAATEVAAAADQDRVDQVDTADQARGLTRRPVQRPPLPPALAVTAAVMGSRLFRFT